MKRFLVPAAFALSVMLFGACVDEPPRRPSKKPGSNLPPLNSPTTVDPNLPPEDQGPPSAAAPDANQAPEVKPPPPVPTQPVKVGEIPYAKPVPGKPGFVFSPYDQYKGYIDVRGFPPGTEVKDPYSQKSFLVP